MIAFVRGKFVNKQPARVIVDVNGVGYDLQISLNTYSAISSKDDGQLHTYLHITENGQTLFGFFELAEKDIFLKLISVSGVGASTARMMLSGMRPQEIVKALTEGNTSELERVKGIGKKTAERLVVELKDKVGKLQMDSGMGGTTLSAEQTVSNDAVQALIALGIAKPAAEQAIKKAMNADNNSTLEELIKYALKNI